MNSKDKKILGTLFGVSILANIWALYHSCKNVHDSAQIRKQLEESLWEAEKQLRQIDALKHD